MTVKIINRGKHPLPSYKTEEAAGADLYANLDQPITLKPLERAFIPTGLFLEIPKGYEAQVRARSGLSSRHGITLINGVGTIDSDYRGEVSVPLVNLSQETYVIQDGERIAQIIFAPVQQAQFCEVEQLNTTQRGESGFGSTGK